MARFDTLRLTAFEPDPAATLPVACYAAPFPARWLRILQRQYQAATGRDRWRLPTRSLVELLDALDANIIHVSSRLADEAWIHAHAPVDREVVAVAVAAWAATKVTRDDPSLDWLDVLADDPIEWTPATLDLLACGRHPNGTARPEAQVFNLLPGHLAGLVTGTGLSLLDHHRAFVLGPVDSSGRRAAVSWPAERIDDDDAGPGLWTPKVEFHVQTVPGYGWPRIHADLTMTRFPLQPVSYVPRRGSRATVTLWLLARDGFLRGVERPTLLGARASRRFVNNQPRWAWDAGLSLALARLTQHRYPDPQDVVAAPDRYADGPISAFVVYSGGTKLAAPGLDDVEDEPDNGDTPRVRSVQHAARVGFQAVDHLELYEQLAALLEPLGIVKAPELRRASTKTPALLHPRDASDQHHTLELWTQSPMTRQAILDTITRHLEFTPTSDPTRHLQDQDAAQQSTLRFTGPFSLTVILRDFGTLAAGIPRPSKSDRTATSANGIQQRLQAIASAVPWCADRRAAIVELQDAAYFARIRLDDPKPVIKQGFALANRRVQCLRPVHEYTPKPNVKRPRRTLLGTRFTMGDISRTSAAVQDALRQLGRVGALSQPPGIPGPCELVGVWVEYVDGADVPLVIRVHTDGTATAQLATAQDAEELPYADLPPALAAGRGRLKRDPSTNAKARIAEFLVGVLGVDDARHDRVVFVRSASFRTRGWDWLQDQHVTPNLLVLPGSDPLEEAVERLTPGKCPGLRIIRVRERGTTGEVPHGFGVQDDGDEYGRASGLFTLTNLAFYGVNPRPSQTQTPKTLTKLDPTQARNVQKPGWNPNPLEIVPVFLQEGDRPEDWAMYTQALRRAYLHTDIASQLPLPLHLASLADEYLT